MPFSVFTIRERKREILNIWPFLPHHCRQKSGLKLPCAKTSPKNVTVLQMRGFSFNFPFVFIHAGDMMACIKTPTRVGVPTDNQ